MRAEPLSTGQELITGTLRDRRLNTASNMAHDGWVHGKIRRESVLRNAKDVVAEANRKSKTRFIDMFLVDGDDVIKAKPVSLGIQKEVITLGHRFTSIVTAGAIAFGVLFMTEEVVGIIDSAQAAQELDRFHR